MKFILKNKSVIEKKGEVLIIDKKNTFFSDSRMSIRIKDIVGIVEWPELIIILTSGMQMANGNLKDEDLDKLKRSPNSIVGEKEELNRIYKEIALLMQEIPIV